MDIRSFNISAVRKYAGGDRLLEKLRACKHSESEIAVRVDVDTERGTRLKRRWDAIRKGGMLAPAAKPSPPKGPKSEPVPPQPIPREKWPRWVKLVAMLRKPEDKGVGDTVASIAAKMGGDKFKVWAERLKIPCGCSERQDLWNVRYPYSPLPTQSA